MKALGQMILEALDIDEVLRESEEEIEFHSLELIPKFHRNLKLSMPQSWSIHEET